MTEGVARARRRLRPTLSSRAQSYLDLIADRLAAAELAGAGSAAAARYTQEAIGFAAAAGSSYLAEAIPPGAHGRAGWVAALRLLVGARLFEDQLGPLIVALVDLDRGKVDDALSPKGSNRGGKATARSLMWKALVLEIVAELAERRGGYVTDAEEDLEVGAGVSARSVRRWRRESAKWPLELQPRSFRHHIATSEDDLFRLAKAADFAAKKNIP